MVSKNSPNKEKNRYIPIVLVSLFILSSLAYFGNFWLEALKSGANQQKDEVLASEDITPPNQPTLQEVSNKTEKPVIELFVMSHCPYGTQMEKAIIPALKTLGNSVDFQLKFVDYAMHEKVELDEQLNEYCIQKNEPTKLISYLECFLEDGNTSECLDRSGINREILETCAQSTDDEFAVTKSFEDKTTWKSGSFPVFAIHAKENEKYGVRGSPTLIINEEIIQVSSRTPNVLLKTICTAFIETPSECETTLSEEVPIPGFGWEVTETASSSATCN